MKASSLSPLLKFNESCKSTSIQGWDMVDHPMDDATAGFSAYRC